MNNNNTNSKETAESLALSSDSVTLFLTAWNRLASSLESLLDIAQFLFQPSARIVSQFD